MRIVGRYRQGVRHFSQRTSEPFRKATEEMLVRGTINVEVDQSVPFQEHLGEGRSSAVDVRLVGDYIFQKCRMEGARIPN